MSQKRKASSFCKDRSRKNGLKENAADINDRRILHPQIIHPGSYASTHAEEMNAAIVPEPLGSKKRYALLLGYCGKEYTGFQINPGVKTVEAEMERGLYLTGAIAKANFGFMQKIGWNRAARTDKGVHAVGQVVSAKLALPENDLDGYIDTLNKTLPGDIQVFHCARTTRTFNAKNACDARTYTYFAPTFIFSEKHLQSVEERNAYRMAEDKVDELNRVLGKYKGTHNFHNFTVKLEPSAPTCKRYIMEFCADKPFVQNDLEWVQMTVHGQSFLLHHIRKMIGLAVDILRGVTQVEVMEKVFDLAKVNIPRAPSEGLYLERVHFKHYDAMNGNGDRLLDTHQEKVQHRISEFRKIISNYIMSTELEAHPFSTWITDLNQHPLDYKQYNLGEWKAMFSAKNAQANLEKEQARKLTKIE